MKSIIRFFLLALKKSPLIILLVTIPFSTIICQVDEQDSLILVKLYNNCDGQNWKWGASWLAGPVSTWSGISTDSGRVTLVYLPEQGLRNNIPSEIGNLTKLNEFWLNKNQLSGTIPKELGKLKELIKLYLDHNQIEGIIPNEIAELTKLNILRLENNKLSGAVPSEFINLTELESFRMSDNQLFDLPDLSSLQNLEDVWAFNNKFTFEDIEPNMALPAFQKNNPWYYSPQSITGEERSIPIDEGKTIQLTAECGGSVNQYNWYKNNKPIGQYDSILTINFDSIADLADYHCEITNYKVPGLTIQTKPYHLQFGEFKAIYMEGENLCYLVKTNPDSTAWNDFVNTNHDEIIPMVLYGQYFQDEHALNVNLGSAYQGTYLLNITIPDFLSSSCSADYLFTWRGSFRPSGLYSIYINGDSISSFDTFFFRNQILSVTGVRFFPDEGCNQKDFLVENMTGTENGDLTVTLKYEEPGTSTANGLVIDYFSLEPYKLYFKDYENSPCGTFASRLERIEFEKQTDQITIFPNPCNDRVTVKHVRSLIKGLSVYNSLGQLVKESNPNLDRVELDLTNLESGLYYIQIITDSHSESKMLIKH
jgi:hypothetical protein